MIFANSDFWIGIAVGAIVMQFILLQVLGITPWQVAWDVARRRIMGEKK